MSRWWRAYSDARNDPKLMLLAPDMFRAWFILVCLAADNEGQIRSSTEVAFALRVSESKAMATMAFLSGKGLFDHVPGGYFTPHNWEERQYVVESSSARVEKYREKRRANGLNVRSDYSEFRAELIERDGKQCIYCGTTEGLVVDHMTPICLNGTDAIDNLALACKGCNSGKAGRTPEMARYEIRVSSASEALARYRDKNGIVTVTSVTPEAEYRKQSRAETEEKASPSRLRKSKAALPSDFRLSEQDIEFALSKGWTQAYLQCEFSRFCDHATASARKQADWRAAWRNWVTSPYQNPSSGVPNGHAKRKTMLECFDDISAEFAAKHSA